ncbi:hypothetical protein RX121_004487 [Salmonella enterica]|nr:hypothetical protein [Salmonella enterica subsp. enterica serovar Anatum]ELL7958903.1 hypothetical protein [Salmonella enterica]ELR0288250.1 hypothetical protein [Salmonella enterica]ELR0452928.1 hypothetical protein [Salmonella enterica]ELX5502935.1 hypothetical protein [Salmonella enterica]
MALNNMILKRDTMMIGNNNLMADYHQRRARRQEKIRDILQFLKDETYSTAEILSEVAQIRSVKHVYGLLNAMAMDGLLMVEKLNTGLSRAFNVYGITQHGIIMAMSEQDDPFKLRVFESSKINLNTLQHRLDTQKIRLSAKKQGYQWKASHHLKLEKGQKYPDALMRGEGGIWAIEVERIAKSPRRYREILELYLNQILTTGWSGVLYLFPNEALKLRVKRVFDSVECVSIQGKTTPINSNILNKYFSFKTYQEFEVIERV